VTGYDKPLPDLDDPVVAPFWTYTRAGELRVQACASCGALRWPAAMLCPECLSRETEWRRLSGRGRVWSVATYHRAFLTAFAEDIPYTIALVDLAEGPVMVGAVTGPRTVAPGDDVVAVFEHVTDEVTLVRFAAADPKEETDARR
jgi:uncharacterized protein